MTVQIPPCGPHCGIAAAREGHCDCTLCHDGSAPVVLTRSDLLTTGPKASMCDQWYAGIGDYRPWDAGRPDGCSCPVSQHAPADEHRETCPVFQHAARPDMTREQAEILNQLITPQPVPAITDRWTLLDSLTCPSCGDRTLLDDAAPDDDLEAFWHHLGQHTQDPIGRLRLWTAALGAPIASTGRGMT
jgi:hypothetical protein